MAHLVAPRAGALTTQESGDQPAAPLLCERVSVKRGVGVKKRVSVKRAERASKAEAESQAVCGLRVRDAPAMLACTSVSVYVSVSVIASVIASVNASVTRRQC